MGKEKSILFPHLNVIGKLIRVGKKYLHPGWAKHQQTVQGRHLTIPQMA